MEGTAAVADAATAEPLVITPSDDAGTVTETSPETEGIVTPPDSEPADEPRTYTEEEFQKALKDQEAKLNESSRRKEQNARQEAESKARAQQFDQRSQAARTARQQTGANSLWALMHEAKKVGEEGGELKWDPQRYGAIVASLDNMAFQHLYEQFTDSAEGYLDQNFPDFAIPRDLAQKLDRATKAYSHADMFEARMEILQAAILSDLTPKLRKQVEEELEKAKGEETTEQAMRGADANKGQRPSGVRGTPPAQGADLSAIIGDPTKSKAEQRAAYKKLYGFEPDF